MRQYHSDQPRERREFAMTMLNIAKDAVVPNHTHPHEQTGYLVSGRLRFVMPGLAKDLDAGDSWIVPSQIPHEVTALEDSVAIDIFSPARTEYIP